MGKDKIEHCKTILKDRYTDALKLEKYRDMERNVYQLTGDLKGEIVRTLTSVKKGYYSSDIHIDEETGIFHVDKEHSYLENENILKESHPDIYNYSVELKKACKDLKDNLANRKETIIEVLENHHTSLKIQLANELKIDVKDINDYGSLKDDSLLKTTKLKNLSVKIYNTKMTIQECKNRKLEDFAPKYKNGQFCENEEIRTLVTKTLGNLCIDMHDNYKILEKSIGTKETQQFCIDMANEMQGNKRSLAMWLDLNANALDRYVAPVTTSKKEKEEKKLKKEKRTYHKIDFKNFKHISLLILSIIFFPITIIYSLLKKFKNIDSERKENISGDFIRLLIAVILLTGAVLLYKYNIMENASYSLIKFGEKCGNNFFDQESWGIKAGDFVYKYIDNNLFLLILLALPTIIAAILGMLARIICSIFVILFVLITVVIGMLLSCITDLIPILVAIWVIVSYLTRSKSLSSSLIALLNIILCVCSILIMMHL